LASGHEDRICYIPDRNIVQQNQRRKTKASSSASISFCHPMLNMFGWITPFGEQGRYLYHPAVWVVLALAAAIPPVRLGRVLRGAWVTIMMSAALFNTLAYVKMLRSVDIAAADAAASCKKANCCETLYLSNSRTIVMALSTLAIK